MKRAAFWASSGIGWWRGRGGVTGSVSSAGVHLVDLHGDVATTAALGAIWVGVTYSYDEFGDPTDATTLTYGWLGGKIRAQAGVGNLTLMGVQLYDPATGRFLQTDPIPGGSANNYDYCGQDPVNCYDLDGTFWGSGVLKKAVKVAKKTAKVVKHAAVSTGQFIARNRNTIALIAVGTVAIVAGTVLTFGLGDALLAAGAGLAEEGSQLEVVELAIHAPMVLGPGLGLAGMGGYAVCRGVRFC